MVDYRELDMLDQWDVEEQFHNNFYKPEYIYIRQRYPIKTALKLLYEGILCSNCYKYKYECQCKKLDHTG